MITSDLSAAGAGNTYTFGTLSIGTETLTVNGAKNVTSGVAGVTFSTGSLTGNTTFTMNNPQLGTVINPTSGFPVTLLTFTGAINPSGTDTITFNGNGNATVTGAIGNNTASSVTMSGTGNLTLSGANTFTGGLTISSGTVTANTSAGALATPPPTRSPSTVAR